jgi:transmembrane sensor
VDKIEHIDDLIVKFLSGEASPEEAMLLEDWKKEDPKNLLHYVNSEKTMALVIAQKSDELDSTLAWKKVKSSIQKSPKIKPFYSQWYFQLAASLALLIGLGTVIFYFTNTPNTYAIAYMTGDQTKDIKLRDGTDVAIAPNSSLAMDKAFGISNRTLRLKGSAYFSVKHQEELPFIIDVGNVFIKDIGTKFNIRSSVDSDTVYVHVDEGIVLLFDSVGSSIEIHATEKALYIRSSKTIVDLNQINKANEQLTFVNARLAEVIIKLNATYKTNILLENKSLENCTITSQFNKENLETVMNILTETMGLTYEKTPTGYLIKGQSCHP